jgi:hypothetical protein
VVGADVTVDVSRSERAGDSSASEVSRRFGVLDSVEVVGRAPLASSDEWNVSLASPKNAELWVPGGGREASASCHSFDLGPKKYGIPLLCFFGPIFARRGVGIVGVVLTLGTRPVRCKPLERARDISPALSRVPLD